MRGIQLILLMLALCCLVALPVSASDENFGQEDDFEDNFGQEDDFIGTESDTATEFVTTEQATTALPDVTTEQQTTSRVQGVFPPSRDLVWSLPMPVIWGVIALVGIGGTVAAVMLLRKYFKENE